MAKSNTLTEKKRSKTPQTAKKAPAKAKKADSKKRPAAQPRKTAKGAAGKEKVTVSRRSGQDRRQETDRRQRNEPVAVEQRTLERRTKVARRRQIDPTTCERDYSNDEVEFMRALDAYKRASGRMFPTCSEILEVVRSLGYEKLRPGEAPSAMEPNGGPNLD